MEIQYYKKSCPRGEMRHSLHSSETPLSKLMHSEAVYMRRQKKQDIRLMYMVKDMRTTKNVNILLRS